MVKKSPFFLLFLVLLLRNTDLSALNQNLQFSTFNWQPSDTCDVPPPDSFQITTIGSDFMILSWEPNATNALHQIDLSETDGVGGWNLIRTYQHVPGSTVTIDSLEPGNYIKWVFQQSVRLRSMALRLLLLELP